MKFDTETDILVVGSGAAAFSAAITARKNGADVIMLEKGALIGERHCVPAADTGSPIIASKKKKELLTRKRMLFDIWPVIPIPSFMILRLQGWVCRKTSML